MSKVCHLFSGSKGNSIYISCGDDKFLVDAGVSAKKMRGALSSIGVEPSEIKAIFVTHEHTDHIKGIRVFAGRNGIPIFGHPDVIAKMYAQERITDEFEATPIIEPIKIGSTTVTPFLNSHDSIACYGYRFDLSDGRSVSVCTDTGYVTDSAKENTKGCDLIFLESNHEVTMLQNGPYPYDLKERILSPYGHLSNFACSEFAVELVKSGTTRIVLSHLSQENNTPDIAYQTTLCALNEAGFKENIDFRLIVSPVKNQGGRPIVL